jgi:hypothetical protein
MKGSLFSAALLSCAVLSSLTLPLAVFGSKVVEVEFQKEPIFSGQLRDFAAPYLATAGLISFGAGAISLSVAGWRSSSRKSSEIAGRLSQLQDELKTKQSQIEEFQLSESHLQAAGLKEFLGESLIQTLEPAKASTSKGGSLEETCVTATTSVTPLYVPSPIVTKVEQPSKVMVQPTVAQPTVLQTPPVQVVSYVEQSVAQESVSPNPAIAVMSQFEALQSQLQFMADQVEKLQAVLAAPQAEAHPKVEVLTVEAPRVEMAVVEAPKVEKTLPKVEMTLVEPLQVKSLHAENSRLTDPTMIEHLHRRLQQLESEWVRQRVAV